MVLRDTRQIPQLEHFQYLQICHFFLLPLLPNLPFPFLLYSKESVRTPLEAKASSLKFKGYMIGVNSPDKLTYMSKWEADCGTSFSPDDWKDCLTNLQKSTQCLTVRETAMKLFTRWYLTPVKLHTFTPLYRCGAVIRLH